MKHAVQSRGGSHTKWTVCGRNKLTASPNLWRLRVLEIVLNQGVNAPSETTLSDVSSRAMQGHGMYSTQVCVVKCQELLVTANFTVLPSASVY